MALFSSKKMASLSPTSPPKGFVPKGKEKKPKKQENKMSGFLNSFGKK